MFELLAEPVSAPRGELVTYASRSATRCSSDGVAEGDDVCPNSGDTNAMIPVSNKTRSVTRVGYKHRRFWRQENTITILAATCWRPAQPSARSFAERFVRRRGQNEIECGIISQGDD